MSDVLACDNGGLLVGTAHSIPDDPREAYREGGALLGCNRLRCARCGAMVRHFDRVQLARELLSGDEYATLWSAADPSSFALLRAAPVPTVRFYFCKCFNFHTAGAVSASSRDDADWSCAGHPQ